MYPGFIQDFFLGRVDVVAAINSIVICVSVSMIRRPRALLVHERVVRPARVRMH